MVTLKDVARRAGVSVSLVSRVLNEDPGVRVRDNTRDRILKLAEQMDYRANHAGRALRLSRSGALALLVPDVHNAVFAELLNGVEDGADEVGHTVLLGRAERVGKDRDILRRLVGEGRVDGCLLQRGDRLDDQTLSALITHDVPVVLVNGTSPRGATTYSSVSVDDAAGARLAAAHLIGLGHTRIGLVSGSRTTGTARRREEGFREALHAAGLRQSTEWTTRLGYEPEQGRKALGEIMAAKRRPTALVVANINAAFGVLGAARELGVDVPGELSVIAIHDDWVAAYTAPPLTTVRMPLYEMGRQAVRVLMDVLNGKEPTEVMVTEPGPELVLRSTTAAPAA